MKFKKDTKGGVAVELGPEETRFEVAPASLHALQLKKILVPVDFSECSKKALQYALPFARQFGAELLLIHVTEAPIRWTEVGPIEPQEVRDVSAELENLKQAAGDSVKVKTLVRTGHAPYAIVDAAKELDADLIIISTHGYTGVNRLLLGSTTERVVRHAPCPVLVVRAREHEFLAETTHQFDVLPSAKSKRC